MPSTPLVNHTGLQASSVISGPRSSARHPSGVVHSPIGSGCDSPTANNVLPMLDTIEEIDNLHLHPDLVEGSNDPMYNSDAASKFTSESIEVVNNGAEISTTLVDSLNNSRITLAEDSINELVNSLNNSMLSLEYNSVSDSLDANDD
ncbi:hypothetical protein PGTUg99_033219 [Puccinia graminis f. sp. tritici]|uniref:Uncharacterized protein n=1 Tax=Puccinia graminis f. sp. tritici TaxID=56615 RepID=A0A5B0MHJ7_PUCGR|nr:hypothetical protein PGTUg99_033219 [Puccinia graminis f. sp. tritici]